MKNTILFEVCEQLLLKPVLLLGLSFLINYTSNSNWYLCFSFCIIIYSFVCQFSFYYNWHCYNQKQSSSGVLRKRCSYEFRKTLQENIAPKTPAQSTDFWLYEKSDSSTDGFCEFCKMFHSTSFKEPFGQLLLHKHSFCLVSHHNLSPFQKQCHTYFLAEYFLALICRLGTRANPLFQTLSQKPISNQIKHLRWSFFPEIVNSLKPLSIFAKKLHRCSTRF